MKNHLQLRVVHLSGNIFEIALVVKHTETRFVYRSTSRHAEVIKARGADSCDVEPHTLAAYHGRSGIGFMLAAAMLV